MDKVNRSRRIHFLAQFIPAELDPKIGVYFGEHVIRVNGQMCLVVNQEGAIGVRALHPSLTAELALVCGDKHWVAHGRVYEQWFLIPGTIFLSDRRIGKWINDSVTEVYRQSQFGPVVNVRQSNDS
jgi:hypothetical protein